ncbi:MAG TPA: hypothetical protein VK853_01720 [Ilumatobacteraceae bacterium]|nr:hypothetical protein [Ilumatobacteraceae bacterium]
MDAEIARKTWRTLEPVHGAIYFVPEAREEYAGLGIDDRMRGYFASRSAPMGAVGPEVVIATFFNFDPRLVRSCMDGVWSSVSPEEITAARLRAADRMIRRLSPVAVDGPEIAEAAELARAAAVAACGRPEGRPLFAGHAELPWPDEPHLVLWHAQTLLREYRGDGHIAALVVEGLNGCEALVTHAAAGDISADALRATRQRSGDDWLAAEERLRSIGWLDPDLALTDLGRERRDWIEARTDELAAAPYDAIGIDGCTRLRELVRPLSRSMTAAFA